MDVFEQAFCAIDDTVIITDAYGYILKFNREGPYRDIRKGMHMGDLMPDYDAFPCDTYSCGGRTFRRDVSAVYDGDIQVGSVIHLADITPWEQVTEQRRQLSRELERITRTQAEANAELEEYARQAEALLEREEQARIARAIHDGLGHAVTELNMVCRMCLQTREDDPGEYGKWLDTGLDICRRAARDDGEGAHPHIREMLESIRDRSPFPMALSIRGEEPEWAGKLQKTIENITREACHNAMDHSLADRLDVELVFAPQSLQLHIRDNGCFRGPLEKGFGLKAMERDVLRSGGNIRFETRDGEGFGILAKWRETA